MRLRRIRVNHQIIATAAITLVPLVAVTANASAGRGARVPPDQGSGVVLLSDGGTPSATGAR
ncbi:hypothetical protein ABZ454_24280 [Streptomyces sp. NPDC005803]|uniref:hypothetical protein n=1 Tax=Streptomyces sp. NPDC005803 TaxID=3154297 RepID=UPI0033DCD71D